MRPDMHPEMSAIHAAALIAERIHESERARTIRLDGADWPATKPPGGRLSTMAGKLRRRS